MFSFFIFLHRVFRAIACRLISKRLLVPRFYANDALRKYAPLLKGRIINVSGWDDRDMEGGSYRQYFSNATSYTISNAPAKGKGQGAAGEKEILIDLSLPIPSYLQQAYDVVYNNTTLEHIFNIEQAFANLCEMSKDAVIIIVPVIQQIHIAETYGDYWRPTTMTLVKLFKKHGFETLIMATNDQPFQPIYAFALAVRDLAKHPDIKKSVNLEMGKYLYGSSLKKQFIDGLLR